MTIITVVMLPVVMIYTAWNYWVFRQRVTTADVAPAPPASAGPGPRAEADRERRDASP